MTIARVVCRSWIALSGPGLARAIALACAATVAWPATGAWAEEPIVITPQGKLVSKEPSSSEAASAVAIDGDDAVIGDWADYEKGLEAGAVYTFSRSGGTWQEREKLFAEDAQADQRFGEHIAISGNTMIVGAPKDAGWRGAAYMFTRTAVGWVQTAKLTPQGGKEQFFGSGVAISGDVAVVAAPDAPIPGTNGGVVFVYRRSGAAWPLEATLTAREPGAYGVTEVAISGSTISAIYDGPSRAYMYERISGKWTETARLMPKDPSLIGFGAAVGLSGDTMVVGAGIPSNVGTNAGAAVIFHRNGGAWAEEATLVAADMRPDDNFGVKVAIWKDTVIIGAANHDESLIDSGAAYVFLRSGGKWPQVSKLVPEVEVESGWFGSAVAISADTALVGAFRDQPQGSASVYRLGRSQGAPCEAGDQCPSGFCVDATCCDSACVSQDPGVCLACSVAAGAATDGVCSVASRDVCSSSSLSGGSDGSSSSGSGAEPPSVPGGCSCTMVPGSVNMGWLGTALLLLLGWRHDRRGRLPAKVHPRAVEDFGRERKPRESGSSSFERNEAARRRSA